MTGTSVSARCGATSMEPSRRRKPAGNSVRGRKAARVYAHIPSATAS